ncbi:MAG: hypothetical protein U1E87_10405 [Alphaproteobacteria bacterium]
MSGHDDFYRDTLARPGDAHNSGAGSIVIAALVVGVLIAAVILVPMLAG